MQSIAINRYTSISNILSLLSVFYNIFFIIHKSIYPFRSRIKQKDAYGLCFTCKISQKSKWYTRTRIVQIRLNTSTRIYTSVHLRLGILNYPTNSESSKKDHTFACKYCDRSYRKASIIYNPTKAMQLHNGYHYLWYTIFSLRRVSTKDKYPS